MFTVRAVAGKAAYAVSCLLATVLIVTSGYAHKAVGQITGLADGIAISGASVGASPGSSIGAMNILLMGLESRTNFEGQDLSSSSSRRRTRAMSHPWPRGSSARRTPTR